MASYRRHDVGKDTKLVEVAQLNAEIIHVCQFWIAQLKDKSNSLKTIAHELWQIIEEMFVDDGQIGSKVFCDLVQVGEYFLKILLDQC